VSTRCGGNRNANDYGHGDRPQLRWTLVDDGPPGMTDADCALVERVVSLPWDEQVRRAAEHDLVILVDLRNGEERFTTVSRKRAATVSPGLRERPKLLPGDLWAAWLVAGDGAAQLIMQMSVGRALKLARVPV
jgi:hypothetical protein